MKLLDALDELRAMAQTGLNFVDGPYDEQRYERILEIVQELYGECLDLPPEEVDERMVHELGQVTPKVGSSAAIFDDDGRLTNFDGPSWHAPRL